MHPLITFPFTVITKPSFSLKIRNRKRNLWPEADPIIEDADWPQEMAGRDHELKVTLWGSESPWLASEALDAIAKASGGVVQDPSLEAAMPDAAHEIHRLRAAHDERLMGAIRFRPKPPFRILFPAFSAKWNMGEALRCDHCGCRHTVAICYEMERRRGYPGLLTLARLFPGIRTGNPMPHPVDTFYAQIHQ
jgi:hypothetical protein